MIRVQTFPCTLARAEADALNRESGRVCTNVLVWHYRIYRRTRHWLSRGAAERLEDSLGGPTIFLHAHSRDAAQQGFYEACKAARSQRQAGLEMRYPHRRKYYRTTTRKNTGIRVQDGVRMASGWRQDGVRMASGCWRGCVAWSPFAYPFRPTYKSFPPAPTNRSNWSRTGLGGTTTGTSPWRTAPNLPPRQGTPSWR
jgi:hypothetical protein